jgi:hypothetical protein
MILAYIQTSFSLLTLFRGASSTHLECDKNIKKGREKNEDQWKSEGWVRVGPPGFCIPWERRLQLKHKDKPGRRASKLALSWQEHKV